MTDKSTITTKPKPSRQRAARMSPNERREQLLACALKSFAAHGITSANHAMVAELAQVSVPTVFFYFETRDALVDAVLSEVGRFYSTTMEIVSSSNLPAQETLMLIGQTMTRTIKTHPDYARVLMEWSVSVRSDIWPKYLRVYKRINRLMAKVIERGQREGCFRPDLDPDDEAAILHAGSTALILMMETGASSARLDRFNRALIQSVLVQNPAPELPAAALPVAAAPVAEAPAAERPAASAPAAKRRRTAKSDAPASAPKPPAC